MRPLPLLLPLIAMAAALAVPAAAPAAAPGVLAAPAASCTGTHAQRTLCRMNLARRTHGLPPLHSDRLLTRAASQKVQDMVTRHYFAHVSPTGETLRSRVAATGWTRGRRSWWIGENLAWGAGNQSTPSALVKAWLHSPPHRRILLSPLYHSVGLGDLPATPSGGGGATLVADFGS